MASLAKSISVYDLFSGLHRIHRFLQSAVQALAVTYRNLKRPRVA